MGEGIGRRPLLAGLALAGAGFGAACSAPARSVSLPPGPAFEPERLPSQDQLWRWIEGLNSFGPRLTGSPGQAASIDYIAGELSALGLTVQRDTHRMTRWTVRRAGLRLAGGVDVPVASAFPYSGRTSQEGVTAPLVWLGEKPKSLAPAAGKIAAVAVKNTPITRLVRDLMFTRKAAFPGADADLLKTETTPLLAGLSPGVDLKAAKAAGVLGVICVFQDMSEDAARGEVLPFTTPYQDCPALWVGPSAGRTLREACARSDNATLTLEADLDPGVLSQTLYAVLEGAEPGETILVNTHTDGPNACEENGAAGLLALARYMAAAPREDRRRSIVFVFVTGHFQIPQFGRHGNQATSAWLADHPELWDGRPGHRKAVAGLTIEHLGCREWKDDADKTASRPTGRLEREVVYTTNAAMQQVYVDAIKGRTRLRALTVGPRNGVHLGEGQPLFAAGIPAIALCPTPDYLCATLPGGGLERLDPVFAHQQVETFARALLRLDAAPTASLGRPDPEMVTPLGWILKRLTSAH